MRFFKTTLIACFCAFSFCQCTFYSTYPVTASEKEFATYKNSRRWAMRVGSDTAERYFRVDQVRADSFSITMGDYKRRADHKADPPRETFAYWRKGGARSRDVFHVTLKEGIPVETTMTLSYNDVHSAFAHGLHPITAFFGLMSFALIILLLSA